MKIIVLTVKEATQAKLVLQPNSATVKIPSNLPLEKQIEVRNKLIKVADMNSATGEFLKIYYKVGTPYLFLNRKVSSSKRETVVTYKYEDL